MIALYVVGGVFAFLGVLIFFAAKAGARSRRNQLERLRTRLCGSPIYEALLLGYHRPMPVFDLDVDGRKVSVGMRSSGRVQLCIVQVRRERLPLIAFRHERLRDRVGRWLFLNREVQTGDQTFDKEVYIETDEEAAIVERTLRTPEARDAILDSVQRGRAVILSKQGVGGTTLFSVFDIGRTEASVRAAVEPLARVADVLPEVGDANGERKSARGDWLAVGMMIGISAAFLVLSLVPHFKPDRWEPWMNADIHAVENRAWAGWLGFVLLAFFWIRGHSRSLRNFALTVVGSLFTVPFLTIQLAFMLNAVGDRSPIVEHTSTISKKSSRSTRSNSYYHVTFPSLFSAGTAGIDIDYDLWKTFAVGDRIVLGMRSGRFGWMWVDTVRREPPE
jgi:hypothetical protein